MKASEGNIDEQTLIEIRRLARVPAEGARVFDVLVRAIIKQHRQRMFGVQHYTDIPKLLSDAKAIAVAATTLKGLLEDAGHSDAVVSLSAYVSAAEVDLDEMASDLKAIIHAERSLSKALRPGDRRRGRPLAHLQLRQFVQQILLHVDLHGGKLTLSSKGGATSGSLVSVLQIMRKYVPHVIPCDLGAAWVHGVLRDEQIRAWKKRSK